MSHKHELKKVSPEEVMEYFRSEGMEITKEEAELIIEFLSSLTLMVIEQYFGKNEGGVTSNNKPANL
ncbi:hypothetical protein [Chryseobacterium wanjuense]